MRKIIITILLLMLCCSLSSCSTQDNSIAEDAYLLGIEQGYEDMFVDMWMASSNVSIFSLGDTWTTDHFSLKIDKSITDGEQFMTFDLALAEMTIDQCIRRDAMLLNIYSVDDGVWDMVLGYDNYYDYTALNYLDDTHGIGNVRLYDDVPSLVVIILIDSTMYTARFDG